MKARKKLRYTMEKLHRLGQLGILSNGNRIIASQNKQVTKIAEVLDAMLLRSLLIKS